MVVENLVPVSLLLLKEKIHNDSSIVSGCALFSNTLWRVFVWVTYLALERSKASLASPG